MIAIIVFWRGVGFNVVLYRRRCRPFPRHLRGSDDGWCRAVAEIFLHHPA
jgi:hypothetical protein